ncbi:AAA family ATPase [Methylobacterium sp. Leaf87]|uniref:DNA polymerase III subunit n=1 Tax=Methylobacterium sp. Leaf87 TaxID=1736243 RepID=UPI00244E8741|nr:AAA family ATPase [Methylobacterium sp. Leaf87]
MDLVGRYRPHCFKEVRGQDRAVAYLRHRILNGQHGESTLFQGAFGSGKTTLARIYATALNCEAPDETEGSPCGECRSCQEMTDGLHRDFREFDGARFNTHKHVVDDLADWLRRPCRSENRWRILFIDEAQAMTRAAKSALLKPIEDAPENTIVFLATTEAESLPETLRSRLQSIEIRSLTAPASVQYLREIAEQEGIQAESDALAVLGALKRGHPRDLLRGLEQVASVQPITRDHVLAAFGVGLVEHLLRLGRALAVGDLGPQLQAFSDWPEGTAIKLRYLQLFLLSLYYKQVLSLSVTLDPLIDAITAAERAPIHEVLQRRLRDAGVDSNVFWQAICGFWPMVPADQDDAALQLRLVLFLDRFNAPGVPDVRAHADLAPRSDRPARAKAKPVARVSGANPRRPVRSAPARATHLARDTAEKIIRAASFLIQEHGLCFTCHLLVCHQLIQPSGNEATLMTEFCRNAANWLRRSGTPVFRLLLREIDPALGTCSRFVAHVPPGQLSAFEAWTCAWFIKSRGLTIADDALTFDRLAPSMVRTPAGRIGFHWKCVRDLCASLDPGVQDRAQGEASPQPLVTLLGIPASKRRSPAGRPDRAYSASEALSQTTFEARVAATGMPYLSAYDDGAYGRIDEGWELDEHRHRQRFSADRATRRQQIDTIFPESDLATRRDRVAALEALAQVFPLDARARPGRDWEIWPPRRR